MKPFYGICNTVQSYLHQREPRSNTFKSTYGVVVKPLTISRLHCAEIFYSLIKSKDPEIIKMFAENEITNTLLDILFEFQFNNQYQIIFEKIINLVFESEVFAPLQESFINNGLTTEIENLEPLVKLGEFQTIAGYRAVLTKLSNYLRERKDGNPRL